MVSSGYTKRSTANAANAPAFEVNEQGHCKPLDDGAYNQDVCIRVIV